ncbi:hypothetical protein [Metabacillus niabensis]|uniref:hypothetical protein n=1 Tax=Metabacillus TaxID=2675233 RepID=UPI001482F69D
MFNKKQKKNNPFLFTASLIGTGLAAYYLTKEALQGEDRGTSYSPNQFHNERENDN